MLPIQRKYAKQSLAEPIHKAKQNTGLQNKKKGFSLPLEKKKKAKRGKQKKRKIIAWGQTAPLALAGMYYTVHTLSLQNGIPGEAFPRFSFAFTRFWTSCCCCCRRAAACRLVYFIILLLFQILLNPLLGLCFFFPAPYFVPAAFCGGSSFEEFRFGISDVPFIILFCFRLGIHLKFPNPNPNPIPSSQFHSAFSAKSPFVCSWFP